MFTAQGCSLPNPPRPPWKWTSRACLWDMDIRVDGCCLPPYFSFVSSWQWWHSRCCCDLFPPLPHHASGLHIGMRSTNCSRKVYDLQIFISGCHDRRAWCKDPTPDLQSGEQRRFTSYRIHHSSPNANNKPSINQKALKVFRKQVKDV